MRRSGDVAVTRARAARARWRRRHPLSSSEARMRLGRHLLFVLAWVPVIAGCATPPPLDEDRLAVELARRPVVLLGEVHDNGIQHRIRADALRRLLEGGARPAIAFEQFDRERQADIDRARRESPPDGALARRSRDRAGARAERLVGLGALPAVRGTGAAVRPADRGGEPVAQRRGAGRARGTERGLHRGGARRTRARPLRRHPLDARAHRAGRSLQHVAEVRLAGAGPGADRARCGPREVAAAVPRSEASSC